MASPDITPYKDVTLYDKTPAEVVAESVAYARTSLPEFTYSPGSVEDALIQTTAYMTSILSGAINRMTPGVLEVLLKLFGVTRISGTKPTGTLTITAIDNAGYTFPAGTRFGYTDRTDPLNPILYPFETTADLTIPNGSTSGTVAIQGTLNVEYPALASGQSIQLFTPIASILSSALAANLTVGADSESDTEYFSRSMAKLTSMSDALVLPSQFENYVLATYTDVYRCKAYSLVNPASGSDLVDPPETGYLTLYAAKVGGASLTPTASLEIEEDLTNRAVAGLTINVEPPTLVPVAINTTFTIITGYVSLDVQADVATAISSYAHPDYWNWDSKIYYNEMIALISNVAGVDRVVSLTMNASATDFSFTKYGSLPVPTITTGVV